MITIIDAVGILELLRQSATARKLWKKGCNAQDIPTRALIVRNGRAAPWKSDCPFLFERTRNPDFELVFSL